MNHKQLGNILHFTTTTTSIYSQVQPVSEKIAFLHLAKFGEVQSSQGGDQNPRNGGIWRLGGCKSIETSD